MHIVLQIPIVDLREATADARSKLSNPSWPKPKMNKKPFIRHFGHVEPRSHGGIDEWGAEDYFCNAKLALQYTDLHKQVFKINDQCNITIRNTFKRFFSDGHFMNKVELGLKDNSLEQANNKKINIGDINLTALLKHYASLPVTINGKKTRLFKSGTQFTSLYYKSSTRHEELKKDLSSFVQDGEICMLAIIPGNEKFTLPQEARLVNRFESPDKKEPLDLYGYTLHLEGYYIKVWLVLVSQQATVPETPSYALLRNLRINLMRIHAEKETIKGILNAVRLKQLDLSDEKVNSKALTDYLKNTGETLFKKSRYNITQDTMLDFALRSEDIAAPGSFSSLEKEIADKFTLSNMKKFIEISALKDQKIILFICSSPTDKNLLDFGKEFNEIQEALDDSSDKANYSIRIQTSVERTKLAKILEKRRPDILHISLHGSPTNGLYFQDQAGNAAPMSAEEWNDILKLQTLIHRPEIIVLSACNSAQHAQVAKPFCNFVAGTKTVFPEKAGVIYAREFYNFLFSDNYTTPEICHQAGVNAIRHAHPAFDPINDIEVYNIITTY